jgi:hypothetical protein
MLPAISRSLLRNAKDRMAEVSCDVPFCTRGSEPRLSLKGGHTPLAADHCQRLPGIARAWEIRGLESALEGLPRLRPITV